MRNLLLIAAVGLLTLAGCGRPCGIKAKASCKGPECKTCTVGQVKYTRDAYCDDCQAEALDYLALSENPDYEVYPGSTTEWILSQPVGRSRERSWFSRSPKPQAAPATSPAPAKTADKKGITIKVAPNSEKPVTVDTDDAPEVQ